MLAINGPTTAGGATTYIVRYGKRVQYQNGAQTALALSNLVGNSATELQWALESAHDGSAAMREVNKVLTEQWRNNPGGQPKVTVLDSRKPL
jgi:hypothetical protein